MKTALVLTATLALALTACERAPADGTREQPAPKTSVEEGAEPADSTDQAPTDDNAPSGDTASAGGYDGPIPMPIRIGTNGPDLDSCASYGEVTGLNPKGDNYLSVRDAPSAEVKERDRLDPGQGVHICAESNGWYGVVYDKGDEMRDCGTDSPVPTPRNYSGPCAQGWVSKKFVTIIAG